MVLGSPVVVVERTRLVVGRKSMEIADAVAVSRPVEAE